MATLTQLEQALIKADEVGNVEDAKVLATEIKRLRVEQAVSSYRRPTGRKEQMTETLKKVADVPVSLAKGAAVGAVGTAAIPSFIEQGKDYLTSKLPPAYGKAVEKVASGLPFGGPKYTPNMQQMMSLLESIPGAKNLTQYQPKTIVGEYAETAGEFIGPSAGVAAIKKSPEMLKAAGILGGGGAAVQETQEQLGVSPGYAMPLTFATTLIGGYAMGRSKASEYAKQALKGVSDEELALASALEKQANDLGLSITASELIDNKIINSLGSIVYGSKDGGKIMYDYIKNRPQEVEKIAKTLMDTMVENPQSIREVYKKVGTTADKALNRAKKDRTKAGQDAGYGVANTESIEPNQVLNIIDQIDQQIAGLPTGNPTIKKLKSMKTRLIKKVEYEKTLDPVTQTETVRKIVIPQTNIKNLDTTLKEFKGYVDNSRTASPEGKMQPNYINNTDRLNFFGKDKNGVLDNLDAQLRTNPNYNAGKNTFQKVSDELVDVVYMHTKDLQKKNITPATITGFIANPKGANKFDIEQTHKILNSQDPDVFPNIVRLYIQDAADKAFKLQPGGPSLKSGFKFYDNLAGGNKANFDEMIKGVADSYGVDKKTLLYGLDRFDEVLQRTARIVDIDNPSMPPKDFNLPREAAQIGSFMWQVKFASKYGNYVKDRTMKDLANVLIKKESVDALIKLAKTNPAAKDASILVTRMIAGFNPIMDAQQEQYLQGQSQTQALGRQQPQPQVPLGITPQ
tara:strand:+ start:151 stop:2370 length:2220 start_codon:yes stop_codon:yes gene_type:complete